MQVLAIWLVHSVNLFNFNLYYIILKTATYSPPAYIQYNGINASDKEKSIKMKQIFTISNIVHDKIFLFHFIKIKYSSSVKYNVKFYFLKEHDLFIELRWWIWI